jgi:hypothetical protein
MIESAESNSLKLNNRVPEWSIPARLQSLFCNRDGLSRYAVRRIATKQKRPPEESAGVWNGSFRDAYIGGLTPSFSTTIRCAA